MPIKQIHTCIKLRMRVWPVPYFNEWIRGNDQVICVPMTYAFQNEIIIFCISLFFSNFHANESTQKIYTYHLLTHCTQPRRIYKNIISLNSVNRLHSTAWRCYTNKRTPNYVYVFSAGRAIVNSAQSKWSKCLLSCTVWVWLGFASACGRLINYILHPTTQIFRLHLYTMHP